MIKKVILQSINLHDYRNFPLFLADFSPEINIFVGPNGSGKTNILESISLLCPGKGLKHSKYDEICKQGTNLWKSNFTLESKLGTAQIDNYYNRDSRNRLIHYNGVKIASAELVNLLNIIWLTPQMEGLFLDSASNRRKFLDRLTYNFYPNHLKHLIKYDYYVQERNKCLTDRDWALKSSWLDVIEDKIVNEAILIHNSREESIKKIQSEINDLQTTFPKASLALSNLFEDLPITTPDFRNNYINLLQSHRKKDSYSGRTSIGVHKTDLLVEYQMTNIAARYCSTGEQKALLISLMLASVNAIIASTKAKPIILLDELFVHLDQMRRQELSDYIISTKIQTFISTTDMIGLKFLQGNANIINL